MSAAWAQMAGHDGGWLVIDHGVLVRFGRYVRPLGDAPITTDAVREAERLRGLAADIECKAADAETSAREAGK